MKIYLLDRNLEMFLEWEAQFADCPEVDVVMDDFSHFMSNHKIQCVVSPANSYGFMNGGYDKAITDYFGTELMDAVQQYIIENFFGEQPVATSFIIDIPGKTESEPGYISNAERDTSPGNTPAISSDSAVIPQNTQKLIHTPTMRTPSKIREPEVIYQCMRTTLMTAIRNNIESLVIPAFGGATGQVPYRTIAKLMKLGYRQIMEQYQPDSVH